MGWRTIAVGIDFSPASRAALRHARRLAEWSGARLRPLHVVDTVGTGPGEPASLDALQ